MQFRELKYRARGVDGGVPEHGLDLGGVGASLATVTNMCRQRWGRRPGMSASAASMTWVLPETVSGPGCPVQAGPGSSETCNGAGTYVSPGADGGVGRRAVFDGAHRDYVRQVLRAWECAAPTTLTGRSSCGASTWPRNCRPFTPSRPRRSSPGMPVSVARDTRRGQRPASLMRLTNAGNGL